MKRKQNHWITYALILFFGCLCGSCERRDLYYESLDINYAEVALEANWTESGVRPDDATVLLYKEGDSKPIVFIMLQDKETINLAEGNYSVIIFNQKIGDFDGIDFRNTDKYSTIQAFAKPKATSSGRQVKSSQLVENPDLLAVDSRDLFRVTSDMVAVTRARISKSRANGGSRASAETRAPATTLSFEPKPCVVNSTITVHIKNMYYIREGAARAQLSGFAESIYLSTRATTSQSATQSFDFAKMEYEEGSTTDGYATGYITTFGLTTPEGGAGGSLGLTFEALLRDKEQTRVTFSRDVTKLTEKDPILGINFIINVGLDPIGGTNPPIEIPPVTPENGGAFVPEIPDWGDEELVEKEL